MDPLAPGWAPPRVPAVWRATSRVVCEGNGKDSANHGALCHRPGFAVSRGCLGASVRVPPSGGDQGLDSAGPALGRLA